MDIFKKNKNSAKTAGKSVPKASAVAGKKAAPAAKKLARVSAEERYKMIEQAAYFQAEKAGFQGDPQAHWVAAEAEVDALLAKKR
mgnify:CR=1 FL=1